MGESQETLLQSREPGRAMSAGKTPVNTMYARVHYGGVNVHPASWISFFCKCRMFHNPYFRQCYQYARITLVAIPSSSCCPRTRGPTVCPSPCCTLYSTRFRISRAPTTSSV